MAEIAETLLPDENREEVAEMAAEQQDQTAAATQQEVVGGKEQQTPEEVQQYLMHKVAELDARQQENEALLVSQAEEIIDLRASLQQQREAAMGSIRLKPADPAKFSGEDKGSVEDWIQTMHSWLDAGHIAPEHRVALARTFLVKGAAQLFRAREKDLEKETTIDGREYIPYAAFETFLQTHFGYQDQEQVARDELDDLKQTGSVEDFARKFQSCVAKIKSMPMSEGDLIQRFRRG